VRESRRDDAKTKCSSGFRIAPYGESEIIAAGIPNSELVIFEESGHLPFVEEQDRFMQAVRRFMGFDQAA
jgi:proline iminopeptidase